MLPKRRRKYLRNYLPKLVRAKRQYWPRSIFYQSCTTLGNLDAPELEASQYFSSSFYRRSLLNYLDLSDPALDSFRRRLVKKLQEGLAHNQLMEWLHSERSVDRMVAREHKSDDSASGFRAFAVYLGYLWSSADFYLPNHGEVFDNGVDSEKIGDYHSHMEENEFDDFFASQKVMLGFKSFKYNPGTFFTTYFTEARKKDGINRFP